MFRTSSGAHGPDSPSSAEVAERLALRRKTSNVKGETGSMKTVSSVSSIDRFSSADTLCDTTLFSGVMHNFGQEVLEQIKELNAKMDEVISDLKDQELHAKMDKVISHMDGHYPLCTGLSHSTAERVPSPPTCSVSMRSPAQSRQKVSFDQVVEDAEDVKQRGLARLYGKAYGINIDLSPPAQPTLCGDEEIDGHAPVNPELVELPACQWQNTKSASGDSYNKRCFYLTSTSDESDNTQPTLCSDKEIDVHAQVKPEFVELPACQRLHESVSGDSDNKPCFPLKKGPSHESSSLPWSQRASTPLCLAEILSRARDRGAMASIAWLYLEDPQLVSGGRMYHCIMNLLVVASCLSMTLQTVHSPPSFVDFAIKAFEYAVDGILSIEIFVRFVVCPNRSSFWIDVHNLLDILNGPLTLAARVMLPLVIEDDGGPQGAVSTVLNSCLAPVRLLKLLRRFEGAHLIYTALGRASETLPVLVYVLLVIITTFASILYIIEPRSNISSLPEAWWFAVVTLSTVGYGDVTPVTPQGKVVVGILIFMAALYMAMPLGIVGQIFADVWSDRATLMIRELARRRFRIAGYTAKDIPLMFYTFNKNRDGVLSVEEFTDMMKQMQFDTSGKRASELFNVFDSDGSGSIDDREFLSTLFPESVADIYGTAESGTDVRNDVGPAPDMSMDEMAFMNAS